MTKVYMGSGGGGGNYTCSPCTGGAGGVAGGGLYISVYTADFEGSIRANGQTGACGTSNSQGGGGSGGLIHIEGESITLGALQATGGQGCGNAGDGGYGRIAIYAESLSYTSSDPAPYIPGATATPTPTVTPTASATPEAEWQDSWYLYEGEQPHAVTRVERLEDEDSYDYDANGNMTARVEDDIEWEQTYNAENRLSSLSDGENSWSFTYDGDGNRVKQIGPNGEVILYLGGGIFEVRDAAGDADIVKYYWIAGQRVAMRDEGVVKYLLTDHLGSVSAILDDTGAMLSQQRYMAYGAPRFEVGIAETDFGYTGQRGLVATGLMDYNARFYGHTLGRFTQADLIVPGGADTPQALNRYAYVFNNPINFSDSSGYCPMGTIEVVLDDRMNCFPDTRKYPQSASNKASIIDLQPEEIVGVVVQPIQIRNAIGTSDDETGDPINYFLSPGSSGHLVYGADLITLVVGILQPYVISRGDGLLAIDYTYNTITQTYDIGSLYVRNLSNQDVVVSVVVQMHQANENSVAPAPPVTIQFGPLGVVPSGGQEFFPLNIKNSSLTVITVYLYLHYIESYQLTVPSIGLSP